MAYSLGMLIALFIALAVIAPAIITALFISSEPHHGTLDGYTSRHARYTNNGTRRIKS